jgi:cyclohexyl-isocyanide hydratase
MSAPFRIGFLLFPHLTPLDVAGPAQFLCAMSETRLHLVWKNLSPVPTDAGFQLVPTDTFETCPDLDMVCVPGGPGQQSLMQDPQVLEWLARQGAQAKWVTSVCTGSLLLGAAGLLKGYRAACHWAYRDRLTLFGAVVDQARVSRDRNRITGGGVTAGIDFGLEVVAAVRGEAEAREIQLLLEYSPEPPLDFGRPDNAAPELLDRVRKRLSAAVASLSGGATPGRNARCHADSA